MAWRLPTGSRRERKASLFSLEVMRASSLGGLDRAASSKTVIYFSVQAAVKGAHRALLPPQHPYRAPVPLVYKIEARLKKVGIVKPKVRKPQTLTLP